MRQRQGKQGKAAKNPKPNKQKMCKKMPDEQNSKQTKQRWKMPETYFPSVMSCQ